MATSEPDIICLDSDDDNDTGQSAAPSHRLNMQSVSCHYKEGSTIDVHTIHSPGVARVVQRNAIPTPNFQYPSTSNRARAVFASRSLINPATPTTTRLVPKMKHYGSVNHVVETRPLNQRNLPNFVKLPQPGARMSVHGENIVRASRPVPPITVVDLSRTPSPIPIAQLGCNKLDNDMYLAPRRFEVSDERLENYTFDAEVVAFRANTRSAGPTDNHFRFKCTFGNCYRTIRGDVNFVFHLWAHVATSSENVEVYTPKGLRVGRKKAIVNKHMQRPADIGLSSRCPECLVIFQTPVLLQIHYTKCHSMLKQAVLRHTCQICEKDMATTEGLREHLKIHNPNDAPYHCRLCSFRSTIRANVIKHYAEKHRDSGCLMCPFCLWTHSPAPQIRMNSIWNIETPTLYVQPFVQHMLGHATQKRVGCHTCAISIVEEQEPTDQPMDVTLRNHRIAHNYDVSRAEYKRIATGSRRGELKGKLKIAEHRCTECAKQISALMKQNEQCPECFKKNFWKRAYDRCGVKPGPIGSAYECQCGLVTRHVEKLLYHYNDTKHSFKLVKEDTVEEEPSSKRVREEDEPSVAGLPYKEDLEEARVFSEFHENDTSSEFGMAFDRQTYKHLHGNDKQSGLRDLCSKNFRLPNVDMGKEISAMNKLLSSSCFSTDDLPPLNQFCRNLENVSLDEVEPLPSTTFRSRITSPAKEETEEEEDEDEEEPEEEEKTKKKRRGHHPHHPQISIMQPMMQRLEEVAKLELDEDDLDDDDMDSS